jgi:hypothetical protein
MPSWWSCANFRARRAEPDRAEPDLAEPSRAEPIALAGPGRAEPDLAEPSRMGPRRVRELHEDRSGAPAPAPLDAPR